MVRASDLLGLPVVDLVQAEKLGKVEEIVVDPDARRLCAFVIKDGRIRRRNRALPAQRVYAIGPEALTLETVTGAPDEADVAALPTLGELAGRKVLSRHGKLLGSVSDILIDEDSGQIIGYALDVPHAQSGVSILNKGTKLWPDYIRGEMTREERWRSGASAPSRPWAGRGRLCSTPRFPRSSSAAPRWRA